MAGSTVPVLAGALCCAVACGQAGPSTIRIAHESDLLSLDPAATSEAATHSILSNLYEALVAFDKDMRLRPALAASWNSLDERTWLIRLRTGVRFHGGRRLSSADVCFTLDRARSDPASGIKGQLWSVEAVEAVDGSTVRVKTLRPDPLLMARLTYVMILPVGNSPGEPQPPPGTGPYRFVRWEKGRVLEVQAFEGYWGGRPSIDRAQFVPVEPGPQSLQLLKDGRLDVMRDVPETMLDQVAAVPGIRVLPRPGFVSDYLWFDSRSGPGGRNPFSDRRVRQAVSLAIDRAELVRSLGGRPLVADQFVQKGVFGYVARMQGLAFDPNAARRLLREAGYERGFAATLAQSTRPGAVAATGLIRDRLAEVGIRLTLERLEWPEMASRRQAGTLPFFLGGWRFENGDATSFLRDCLYTRDPVRNYGSHNPGFSDPNLDRLIDESGAIFDDAARLRRYEQVMRLAMDEMPLVPLYHRTNLYAVSSRVRWEPRLDGKLLAAEMSLVP